MEIIKGPGPNVQPDALRASYVIYTGTVLYVVYEFGILQCRFRFAHYSSTECCTMEVYMYPAECSLATRSS